MQLYMKATEAEVNNIFHRVTQGRFRGKDGGLGLPWKAQTIRALLGSSLLACDFEVARERGLAIELELNQWTRAKPSC